MTGSYVERAPIAELAAAVRTVWMRGWAWGVWGGTAERLGAAVAAASGPKAALGRLQAQLLRTFGAPVGPVGWCGRRCDD